MTTAAANCHHCIWGNYSQASSLSIAKAGETPLTAREFLRERWTVSQTTDCGGADTPWRGSGSAHRRRPSFSHRRLTADPPYRLDATVRCRFSASPCFRLYAFLLFRFNALVALRFSSFALYRFTAPPPCRVPAAALRRRSSKPLYRFAAGIALTICLTSPPKRLCRKARRREGGSPPLRKSGKPPRRTGEGMFRDYFGH